MRKYVARNRKMYKTEMIKDAGELSKLGFTNAELADYWGVNRTTVLRWSKRNPELGIAINKGRAEAEVSVTRSLFKSAIGGNVLAMIYFLKNRASERWSDRPDVHIDMRQTNNVTTVSLIKDINSECEQIQKKRIEMNNSSRFKEFDENENENENENRNGNEDVLDHEGDALTPQQQTTHNAEHNGL